MTDTERSRQAAIVGLFALLVSVSPLRAQATLDPLRPRNRQLLAVVDSFFAHPLRPELWKAVFDSARDRTDVRNIAYTRMMPWRCYADTASTVRAMDQLLLYGFIAGNMQRQLRTGVKQQETVAGLEGQLRVYETLRAKVLQYVVPEIEIWRQYRDADKLVQLTDSLLTVQIPCKERPARFPGVVDLQPISDSLDIRMRR